jgi:hypothetical protein
MQEKGEVLGMPTWIARPKPPSQDLTRKILRYFHRVSRPVFLGQIALEIGHSLSKTEDWVEDLVESGELRRATHEEMLRIDASEIALVYVLVGKPDPRFAFMP